MNNIIQEDAICCLRPSNGQQQNREFDVTN